VTQDPDLYVFAKYSSSSSEAATKRAIVWHVCLADCAAVYQRIRYKQSFVIVVGRTVRQHKQQHNKATETVGGSVGCNVDTPCSNFTEDPLLRVITARVVSSL